VDQLPSLVFRYRLSMAVFLFGLIVSGLTAFPLLWELEILCRWFGVPESVDGGSLDGVPYWLARIRDGLRANHEHSPFMAYVSDWLAFAHLAIAVFFIGPLVQPALHRWTLWSGIIACIGVVPLAHIAGPMRGIPIGWRWLDCMFGIFGSLPLIYCLMLQKRICDLQRSQSIQDGR
jgi:hypothetical protein